MVLQTLHPNDRLTGGIWVCSETETSDLGEDGFGGTDPFGTLRALFHKYPLGIGPLGSRRAPSPAWGCLDWGW